MPTPAAKPVLQEWRARCGCAQGGARHAGASGQGDAACSAVGLFFVLLSSRLRFQLLKAARQTVQHEQQRMVGAAALRAALMLAACCVALGKDVRAPPVCTACGPRRTACEQQSATPGLQGSALPGTAAIRKNASCRNACAPPTRRLGRWRPTMCRRCGFSACLTSIDSTMRCMPRLHCSNWANVQRRGHAAYVTAQLAARQR